MSLLSIATIVLLAESFAPQQLSPKPSDFVASGDYVYGMLLPPKVVEGATVQRAVWSADGRYLVGFRQDLKISDAEFVGLLTGNQKTPPAMFSCIFMWSKASGKSVELLREPAQKSSVQALGWIGTSGTAWALLHSNEVITMRPGDPPPVDRSRLCLITAATNSIRELQLPPGETISWVYARESQEKIAIVGEIYKPLGSDTSVSSTVRFVDAIGQASGVIQLPEGFHFGGLSEKGAIYATRVERQDLGDGKWKVTPQWSVYDANSRRFEPVPNNAAPKQPFETPKKSADLHITDFPRGQSGQFPLHLLGPGDKEPAKALVTMEAQFAELSPTMDAVFYVTRGVGLVRSITKMSRKFYEDSLAAAQRTEAMSNAKQVALAALIYAAEHDDVLPPSSGDWVNLFDAYARNNKLFDGFNYTFAGGSLRDVENPSQTELGYITMQGGRVVAYVDGHVKWIPD